MDGRRHRFLQRALAILSISTLLFVFFCVPLTLAQLSEQAAVAPAPQNALLVVTDPTPQDWAGFLQAIGSWGTLNRLGMAAVAAQGVMLLARSQLGDLTGKAKLALVSGSTMIFGVLALRTSGLDWGQSLMHSTTVAAMQVFAHQITVTYLPPKKD